MTKQASDPDSPPRAKEQREPGPSNETIYQAIYDAIIEHRLAPGAKLGQEELGEIFGVSKTRVRPILYRLAEQKIVSLVRNRGAFVAEPALEEVRAIIEARRVIEEGIIRTVTRNVKPGKCQPLLASIAKERESRLNNETAHAHRLAGRFHILIAELTDNPVLVDVLHGLISRNALAVAMYQNPSAAAGCSLRGHQEMLDAIVASDEEGAVSSMSRHFDEIEHNLNPDDSANARHGLRYAFNSHI